MIDPSQAQPGTMYLQVFSAHDLGPAQEVYLKMKSRGHNAVLDNLDPQYFRIVIGPFATREAADEYQRRLNSDGINSFLRKF